MQKGPESLGKIIHNWRRLAGPTSPRREGEVLYELARLLTFVALSPESLSQALEILAHQTGLVTCLLSRLVSPSNVPPTQPAAHGSPLQLQVQAAYPLSSFSPAQLPPVRIDLYRAACHRRAVDLGTTVVVRQEPGGLSLDEDERALLPTSDWHSACIVSLMVESRVLGLLTLGQRQAWKDVESPAERVRFFEGVGALFAAALARIEVEQKVKRYASQTGWLSETHLAIESATSIDEMRQRLIEVMGRALDATSSYFLAFDERNNHATTVREFYTDAAGRTERISNLGTAYDMSTTPIGLQTLLSGRAAFASIEDPNAEPMAREFLARNEGVCLLVVPLRMGDRMLGLVSLWQSRRGKSWTPDQMRLAEQMASRAAAGLHRAELVAREQRRTEQLKSIAEMSSKIAVALDVEDLARLATRHVCANFECDDMSLYVKLPESSEAACWSTSSAEFPKLKAAGQRVRIDPDSWVGRAISDSQTIHMMEAVTGADGTPQMRPVMAVPLKTGGQVLGVLQIRGYRTRDFDPLDISTLETLASQFAAGIASAHAQQVMREHAAGLQTMQRLSREMTASLDVEEVYHAIYRGTRELMDCDAFFIAVYDEKTETCEFAFRVDKGVVLPPARLPLGYGMTGYVIRARRSIIVADLEQETRFAVQQWGSPLRTQSLVCVPMQIGDRILGALSAQSYARNAYDEADLQILATFSGQAAVAINNARLFAESQRKMEQLSVLNEVGRIVSSTIEIDRLLELVYDQVRRILRADSYYVALADPEAHVLNVEILVDEGERFQRLAVPTGAGLANLVVERRAPVLLRNLREQGPSLDVKPFLLGKQRSSLSWLGVPMMTSEHLIGVLAVGSYEAEAFDEGDQEVLQNVATQAAIAIDNARHHAEVEEQARRDSLTQVLNHGYFLVRLQEEVERAPGAGLSLSLIMLDIDHFKVYNDRYGHLAGDAILRGAVQAIRDNIKRTDLVGRWGGEEFVIALPGTDRKGALIVAERIRRTLAEMNLKDDQGRAAPVPTVSQGIATLPYDANEAIALIDIADRRLYEAKEKGRDQIGAGDETEQEKREQIQGG